MKVFQAIHSYNPYLKHFEKKYRVNERELSYNEMHELLVQDRFYAAHVLKPCLDPTDNNGFYTMWDYPKLQTKWAKEKGWNETNLKKILFAQIEEFKADVFYNCSPIRFSADEIKQNINAKTVKIAWFASPEKKEIYFNVYHSRLTNYPVDAGKKKSETGFRSDLFHPAYDPVMEKYAKNEERPIDIFFYGQYISDYFKNRNTLIDQLIELKKNSNWNIQLAIQYHVKYRNIYPFKRPGKIRSAFGMISSRIPFLRYFPPEELKRNVIPPVYGLDLYNAISKSKIVFNAAVDFTGDYKVNMRNYESLGCGAHMISDKGIYPEGLYEGIDFSTYNDFNEFAEKANYFLINREESRLIAKHGNNSVKNKFSKDNQWSDFQKIIERKS